MEEHHLTEDEVLVLKDTSGTLSFTDIKKRENAFFAYSVYKNAKKKKGTYWVKFKLKSSSAKQAKWLLQLPLHTNNVTLYIPDKCSDNYTKVTTGQNKTFESRQTKVRSIVFDIFPKHDCAQTYYAQVTSDKFVDLSFLISNQRKYTKVLVDGYIFLGIIYGFLILMAIYNLILYLSTREKIYVHYVFYVLCSALFLTWKDGLGFQYLWPETPGFNAYHFNISFYLLFITFVVYARSFLSLRKYAKRIDNLLILFVAASTGQFIYHLFYPDLFNPFPLIYMVSFVLLYIVSVYQLIRGIKQIRYFLTGFTFILLALFVIQFRYEGLLSWSWFSEYILNFGMVIEVIAMSLAIGDRLNIMRRQKMDIQQEIIHHLKEKEEIKNKVNRELENKVKERTVELNEKIGEIDEANGKLKHLVEELKNMNIQLDLDNWKLKKSIKKELENRISDKTLSYEKFLEVFPSEDACFRYLERLKWGENNEKYYCRKCGNKKFIVGNQPFSKKCSKCNYIETVKARTLFHRLHFPIQKAFYIAYITAKGQKTTLEQLSKELDLRKNTCWTFRKKVLNKKAQFENGLGDSTYHKWENLMLRSLHQESV